MHPVVIVVGFSRPRALERLLRSLNEARYPSPALLLISLDGGASPEVRDIADAFEFKHGESRVLCHERNMGLREHILWCGDQTAVYDSVIVLEDDLIVDPFFYLFAVAALRAYGDTPSIAGIALYSPRYNENAALPFEPLYNGQSTFLMAAPCSSGQLWTRAQWQSFRRWYGKGERNKVDECAGLPVNVKQWPESSWKKYFAAYLVENNLYFVYPYLSYTSNCSDAGGVHIHTKTNMHQVPMGAPDREAEDFVFKPIDRRAFFYDAHMEISNLWAERHLGLGPDTLVVDLYATKDASLLRSKPFCLTSRRSTQPLMGFPLEYRPMELNILHRCDVPSQGYFFLSRSRDILPGKISSRLACSCYWIKIPFSLRFFLTLAGAFLIKIKNKFCHPKKAES